MDNSELESLGIFDLRNYARLLGVKSPTQLKRPELLKQISEGKSNGAMPDATRPRKGRTPKTSSALTQEYLTLKDKLAAFEKHAALQAKHDALQGKYNDITHSTVFQLADKLKNQ